MGKTNNGEKNQVFGTDQGRSRNSAPRRHRGAEPVGAKHGDEAIGVDRPYWAGRDYAQLFGGILSQLIEEMEDQLGDCKDDIARLQRKATKLEKRLANLERLKAIQEGSSTN